MAAAAAAHTWHTAPLQVLHLLLKFVDPLPDGIAFRGVCSAFRDAAASERANV